MEQTTGKFREALADCGKDLEIRESVARARPGDRTAQYELAYSYQGLAGPLLLVGDLQLSKEYRAKSLALLTELKIISDKLPQVGGGLRSTSLFDIRVTYVETVDVSAELVRLKKELERLTKDIASKERQLGDETFRSRAPEKIIQGLQTTLEERRIELKKVSERIQELDSRN